jgi:hypothetical protein
MRYCDCASVDLLLQVIFGKFGSRDCPQYFGTGPMDQQGTRHGGPATWMSRTFVFVWSDLENICDLRLVIRALLAGGVTGPCDIKCRGTPWAGGVTSLHHLTRRGGVYSFNFLGELGTSRRRRVIQGPDTSSRGRLQVQGRDTSRHYRLTGARHITSLLPTKVQCPRCGYPSASFYLRRFNPLFLFRRRSFFPSPIHRISHAQTLTHQNRSSGSKGYHGESA